MADISMRTRRLPVMVFALTAALGRGASATGPADAAQLVQSLRTGGFVVVMRHAQSPAAPPTASSAEADNPQRERQLDATGKADARALGAAMQRLGIPFAPIYSSPTYRALETLHLAALGPVRTVPQLAEGARGMAARAAEAQSRWLREAVRQPPRVGRNTLVVTHTPNIVGAFGPRVADIKAGEMLVFQPRAGGAPDLVGRLTVAQWRRLAGS